MKVLVIEDNDIKYGHIQACLDEARLIIEPIRAPSYQSGLQALIKRVDFGCVILDMTLPVYDVHHGIVSVNTLTFGGRLVLREAVRRGIAARIVVLSQYDVFPRGQKEITFAELRAELMEEYKNLVLGCVRMDTSSIGWRKELIEIIENL